jgi:cytochrome c556
MRIAVFATASLSVLLAACGGPETSQANNASANMSGAVSPPVVATGSAVAAAPDFSPVSGEQAKSIMHERHEGMETIGKASKAIKRELDGASPDLAIVRASAARIADLSQKASGWFHAGTGPDIAKTGAKPEIWQSQQDFADKLAAFQKEAQAFNGVAAGDDATATKSGFADLGKTCKACHDKYRSEMHH